MLLSFFKRNSFTHILLISSCILSIIFIQNGCTTGVNPSPTPGFLKVTLQADPSDTVIKIGEDTVTVSKGDQFNIKIYQGKLYKDTLYANLFQNLNEYQVQDHSYNILKGDESGNPEKYVIFMTRVPPGSYTELNFGMTASELDVGQHHIPIELPPDVSPLLDFNKPIKIQESDTTVVNLLLQPFQSVNRFRDSFQFTRKIQVTSINQKR